jgi:hypothetical protein
MKTAAEFEEFLSHNPEIWAHFVRYSFEVINAGMSRCSVDSVTERIRWYSNIEVRSTDEFRLNNDYRPHFARKWVREFPDYATCLKPGKRVVI